MIAFPATVEFSNLKMTFKEATVAGITQHLWVKLPTQTMHYSENPPKLPVQMDLFKGSKTSHACLDEFPTKGSI